MKAELVNQNPPTQSTMNFVKEFGAAIAKSQMFGCENESQGQVFAMACIARGRDPLSIPEDYHLMHGKLTLRSDAMLGRLSKAGGNYRIVEHTSEAAAIEVEFRGRKYSERFTWEEAKQEPFVYAGKTSEVSAKLDAGKFDELRVTTNYATPRRRSQHLWARVVSDAVRVVAPELVTGCYTPEEVATFNGNGLAECEPVEIHAELVAPTPPAAAFSQRLDARIEPEFVERILGKIKELVQMPGGGDLPAKIRAKMAGRKIAELTHASGELLMDALQRKEMELFFDASLKFHEGDQGNE